MVNPESFNLTRDLPRQIIRRQTSVDLTKLERASNGAWFVIANLSLTFELRDGRTVRVDKQVRIRGRQDGKKSNPKPFGKKSR